MMPARDSFHGHGIDRPRLLQRATNKGNSSRMPYAAQSEVVVVVHHHHHHPNLNQQSVQAENRQG
jgi:hypothetical protein